MFKQKIHILAKSHLQNKLNLYQHSDELNKWDKVYLVALQQRDEWTEGTEPLPTSLVSLCSRWGIIIRWGGIKRYGRINGNCQLVWGKRRCEERWREKREEDRSGEKLRASDEDLAREEGGRMSAKEAIYIKQKNSSPGFNSYKLTPPSSRRLLQTGIKPSETPRRGSTALRWSHAAHVHSHEHRYMCS